MKKYLYFKIIFFISLFFLLTLFSFINHANNFQEKKITVIIYSENNYAPYSWEEDGVIKGIYSDILKFAFSQMKKYNVVIKPVPWKRGLMLMRTGLGFALYPPYYRPNERPYMDYSIPILNESFDVACIDSSKFKNKKWPQDYKGLRVGINAGFSIPGLDKVKKNNIKIQTGNNTRTSLLQLSYGRLDCYINDDISILWGLKKLKKEGKKTNIKICQTISSEKGYLGFTKNGKGKFPYKKDFVIQFNKIILQMKKSGKIREIVNSYVK